MRVGLVSGDTDLTRVVRGALSRSHDVRDEGTGARHDALERSEADALVVVWPRNPLGRAGAARGLSRAPTDRTLVVISAELTSDRLGIVDAGIEYLVDPFHGVELLRRVERMHPTRPRATRMFVGDTMLDEGARTVERNGHRMRLTRKEFDLLAHLMRNQGMVQSRTQLLEAVWSSTAYSPNVVDVTVSSLRQKLEAHGSRLVHTVWGVGYICRPDIGSESAMRSLIDQRDSLIEERQRLIQRREALIDRARRIRGEGVPSVEAAQAGGEDA
jgi:DNA-binding response OmpR family regulator